MTIKEELAQLIFEALKESDYAPDPAEVLRLVLAEIWDEGYDAGVADENAGWNTGWDRKTTPNPYRGDT